MKPLLERPKHHALPLSDSGLSYTADDCHLGGDQCSAAPISLSSLRPPPRGGFSPFSRRKDLPVHGRAQGGEEGSLVIEDNPIDWTYRPADLQDVHGAFAVFVTGNSMMPKYKNQDIAYIHPSQTVRRGRYVLIETKKRGGFIKEFQGWEGDTLVVRQFNPVKELRFDRSEVKNVMLVIGSLDY